ncbi:MAG: isochorismate synthase [Balneolaceae bacterium]|nr:isochorismate synthase [Balneolaceae bacterium]
MNSNLSSRTGKLPDVLLRHLETPGWEAFLEEAIQSSGDRPWLSLSLPVEELDPLACLEIDRERDTFRYYLEQLEREEALGASGSLLSVEAEGRERFGAVRRRLHDLKERFAVYNPAGHSGGGPLLLGGFSFFGEEGASANGDSSLWEGFRPAMFHVPRWSVLRDGRLTLLTLNLENGEDPTELDRRVRRALRRLVPLFELDPDQVLGRPGGEPEAFRLPGDAYDRRTWTRSVSLAVEAIRGGELDKVVLARKVDLSPGKGSGLSTETLEPTAILHDLRRSYPGCWSFLVQPAGGRAFLGCTPERLASFQNRRLLTEALAGSIRRGGTASEDALYGKELLASAKNREEHNLVVRDIRDRLQPYIAQIENHGEPRVKKLSNVQHLYTPITARLEEEADPLTLVGAMHPTPAVGGYPWSAAAPWIRRLENFDRGWYAGPLGWLNLDGGGEFVVGIRSALVGPEGVSLFAGCGIVRDSDPETEWEETNLKLEPMLSALNHA